MNRGRTWEKLADLPLKVDGCTLGRLEQQVSSGFLRVTTPIELSGAGCVGIGEDVTYDEQDQTDFQSRDGQIDLAGNYTLDSFSQRLDDFDLFQKTPTHAPSIDYRRWAFESAALDLALRQKGVSLVEQLERKISPVRFVVSLRLGEPPTIDPLRHRLARYPWLEFKLDPTSDWDETLIEQLVATNAVVSVDFKGHYEGTDVDQAGDVELYRRVLRAFPRAWIEDPLIDDSTRTVIEPQIERVTWDAPIHSVEQIRQLDVQPRIINIKPSRFGRLSQLFEAYDHCEANGIEMFGGGQFELGLGRGQLQYLASMFHPDGPNDIAPPKFNVESVPDGLPSSPLQIETDTVGFQLA